MRRSFILLGAFLFSGSLFAQVPGFMGKRFSLFLEGNPTPASFVMNENNKVAIDLGEGRLTDQKWYAFNFRPQITAEYLVHRDVSLGLSYSRISMGTIRGYFVPGQGSLSDDKDVVRGQAAGLHIKIYKFDKSSSIAPIGFYKTFSVYITQTNTYDDKRSKKAQFKNNFIYPVATFSVGRQSMIFNNLIVKTGAEFGWTFVPGNFFKESSAEWTVQEYAGYNLHQSLFGYYVFSLNVAVGYTFF